MQYKIKKSLTIAAVLALCLAVTSVSYAGSKKHSKNKKEKPAVKTEVVVNKDAEQTEVPAKENETPTPPPVEKPVEPVVELPYVLADDNLSNLQLNDPNKPVFDKYTVRERVAAGLPTQLPALTPYREGKVAYLTFDDGPEGTNTPGVLDVLKAEGVKGTFYVVGNQCYAHPEVLKRIFNEGHALGNHTYSHDYDVIYPNVNNFLEEIYRTEQAMKEIIGVRPLNIRAPGGTYGMFTSAYPPALNARGLVEHDWNVCIDDAVGGHPTAYDFIQKVREQTASGINPAIVLMHSSYGKGETVRALPEIIRLLRERGYSFGVVTPMTPQPW